MHDVDQYADQNYDDENISHECPLFAGRNCCGDTVVNYAQKNYRWFVYPLEKIVTLRGVRGNVHKIAGENQIYAVTQLYLEQWKVSQSERDQN